MMLGYLLVSGALLLLRQESFAQISTSPSDGFNLYKDYLRTKIDEPYEFSIENGEPKMYVYRTPTILLVSPIVQEGENGKDKRGANRFKNFMLQPQRDAELGEAMDDKAHEEHIFHFPRVAIKRSADKVDPCSKTIEQLFGRDRCRI